MEMEFIHLMPTTVAFAMTLVKFAISILLMGAVFGQLLAMYDSIRVSEEDPEELFFGELLFINDRLPHMQDRIRAGAESFEEEAVEFSTAIQRVAGVNRAGRLYDPSNGRFIARKDLHSWVTPADLLFEILETGAFAPAPTVLN